MSKTAKHRAERHSVPLRWRIAGLRNRWHVTYKPTLSKNLKTFITKGLHH